MTAAAAASRLQLVARFFCGRISGFECERAAASTATADEPRLQKKKLCHRRLICGRRRRRPAASSTSASSSRSQRAAAEVYARAHNRKFKVSKQAAKPLAATAASNGYGTCSRTKRDSAKLELFFFSFLYSVRRRVFLNFKP